MKTNCHFLSASSIITLASCLLVSLSQPTMAQTYTGQLKLTSNVPSQLESNIFPLSNRPAAIRVIFNNRTGGTVRVMIRDEQGKVHYDESESIALYRRNFDLSGLPGGNYTIELSKQQEHIVRTFAINTPALNLITMDVPFKQDVPDLQNSKAKRITSNP